MKQYNTPSVKSNITENPIWPVAAGVAAASAVAGYMSTKANIRQMPEKNLEPIIKDKF